MYTRWAAGLTILVLLVAAYLAAVLALASGRTVACPVGDDSDLTCARGFEGRERAEQVPFRWTDGDATLRFSGVGYGTSRVLSMRLWSGRPEPAPPIAVIATSGAHNASFFVGSTPRRYTLLLPLARLDGDVLRVRLRSETFAPGSGRRTLGVSVADARVLALGGQRWPGPLFVLSLLALALIPLARPLTSAASSINYKPTGMKMGGSTLVLLAAATLAALMPSRAIAYLPAFAVILAFARMLGWLRPGALLGTALVLGLLELTLVQLGDGPAWRAPLLLATQSFVVLVACAWLLRASSSAQRRVTLAELVGAALVVRLLGVGLRLLTGDTFLDGDAELFYAYGMALQQVGLPVAEYPSGALVVWAALATLAGESRERFALLLPLLNTLCDLGVVACIALLGRRLGRAAVGATTAAFYALSPLLLPFVLAKYDALPTLLLVGGLAAFAYGYTQHNLNNTPLTRHPLSLSPRYLVTLSGLLLGLGGAIKWAPLLAAPIVGLFLLRFGAWRGLLALSTGGVVGVGVMFLPFVLRDLDTFLMPYRLQGGRGLTGQSIWFLVALPFDRELLEELPKAWSAVRGGPPVALMVAGQAAALLLLAASVLYRPTLARALALAALAPALFLLLNRVYSPQYMATISAALLVGVGLIAPPRRVLPLLGLLALAQAANLLIWPLFSSYWLVASGVMFGAALGLAATLATRPSGQRGSLYPGRSIKV